MGRSKECILVDRLKHQGLKTKSLKQYALQILNEQRFKGKINGWKQEWIFLTEMS